MVIMRLIGWGCLFFGGSMIIVLQISSKNQPAAMMKVGVIMGIALVGIGLLLIKL